VSIDEVSIGSYRVVFKCTVYEFFRETNAFKLNWEVKCAIKARELLWSPGLLGMLYSRMGRVSYRDT
jgi:hypothetical protein